MKNKHNILLLISIIGFLGAFPTKAFSAPIWHWAFDQPIQVVSPADTVTFTATLFNDPASTEVIYGSANKELGYWVKGASCCSVELLNQYTLQNPGVGGDVRVSPNFFDQFNNLILAPGQNFNFTYLYLLPKNGAADTGTYNFLARLNLGFKTDGSFLIEKYSDANPTVIVQSNASTVPLPPSVYLFMTGLLSIFSIGKTYLPKALTGA